MLDLDHLEKAQRISLTMQVELSLKGALITGSLKPGARLITKEIADKLGTSITPVREALLRLVSAGALHATPAQAFLVPEVTLDRYNEINAIRKQLEPMAVAAAVRICLSKSWRRCANCRTYFMRPCATGTSSRRSMRIVSSGLRFISMPKCRR